MVLFYDVTQRTLVIPELREINVMWEEVSNGIGTIKPHMRTVYVVYTNPDDGAQIGCILEENDGLGYNFTPYIYMDAEGSHVIDRDSVLSYVPDTLKTHEERMQALLLLLNTDPETYERQREVYAEDSSIYEDDGQPTEQEELEYYEGEIYESMYGDDGY